MTLRAIVTVLLTVSGVHIAIGQPADAQVRAARLTALGKLWATIKYFHPGLSDSRPGEWDTALLDAIPHVQAAHSRDEYATAVRRMTGILNDPVTRIADDNPEPPISILGFASVEVRHRVMLVTSGRVEGDPLETADVVRQRVDDVDAIVFDVRPGAVHPWLWDIRWLSTDPLPYPTHRFRLHVGNSPIRGAHGSPFFTGVVTRTAPVAPVVAGATNKRVVFVVRDGSELPLLAAALQDVGRGWIVSEQPIDDRHFARHGYARHYRMSMGENLTAYVRTSEMLRPDGTVGVLADVVAPDDALGAAFQAARAGAPHATRRPVRPTYEVRTAEIPYDETSFPSEPLRLLAVFRTWAVFEWLYPYRSLMDREWGEVLQETVPKVIAARDAREYHFAIAEMVASVGDTRAGVGSSVLTAFWGDAAPGLALRPIEDRAVVVAITHPSAHSHDVSVGDVVVAVDGQPADVRLAALARYISASTPQALRRDAVNRLLRGADGTVARIRLLRQDGTEKEIGLERRRALLPLSWTPVTAGGVHMLSDNVAYIDLRVLQLHEVDAVFEQVKDARAIIFDMRGYPNTTGRAIAAKLTDRRRIDGAMSWIPIAFEPDTQTVQSFRASIDLTPADTPYRGRTVMLIDERAQSRSEATAQLLRAVHGTLFIGSASTGANGEGSNFSVPGGIEIGMSATGASKLDGSQLQRIGITPDIEVHPTIAGIRAGRDEVLERAVEYLRSSGSLNER